MKNIFKAFLGLILMGSIAFTSCTKNTITTMNCTNLAPTYNNDIKAIMDANCAISGCHTTLSLAGGYDFTNYANCKNAKDRIVGSVQHNPGFLSMPQTGAKLSDATIQKIACWAENGCMQ